MASKERRKFDFCRYKQRHIALKLLYFGWDYDGLAEQSNSENTIEYHLFHALTKACLIESRATCRFNRCGRTDKGVSSYGQVVDLDVRSSLLDENDPQNIGLFTPDNYSGLSKDVESRSEIDYMGILNRLLPDHIKVIAWAPVSREFSSRFNCLSRSYSYIFPKGDLCLESMNRGLEYLVGQHDFRNLCSFDIKNGVLNHTRTILSATLKPISLHKSQQSTMPKTQDQYTYYEVIIVGQAFLYHQIRCIMTMIFLIGRKQERPELIKDLLDIEKCPARPKYCRASPLPLSLFDCQYKLEDLPLGWIHSRWTLLNTYRQLKQLWLRYKTKSEMIERVLLNVGAMFVSSEDDGNSPNLCSWKDFGLDHDNMSDTKYVAMMERPREDPLELKIETMKSKKRLKTTDEEP